MREKPGFSAGRLLTASLAALVFAGICAIAQDTPQAVPGGENISTAHRGPHFAMAAVHLPEVLSDSMGVDFAPYFHTSVLPDMRRSWHAVVREKGIAPATGQKVVAEFTILKDGTLDGLKITESSGDAEIDQTALEAITRSAPFAALPAEFKGSSIRLRCQLDVFFPHPDLNGASIPHVIAPHAEPQFSDEARRKKIQGTVLLALVVGPDGVPTDITVTRPLGHGLDEKAIETVQQWRFHPAMKDGNPVAAKIAVEVNFRLY